MTEDDLFWQHADLNRARVSRLKASGVITFAGNKRLRIYGHLSCRSGKRMHYRNRVFFACEGAAKAAGFRPCGNCMRDAYLHWRQEGQKVV